MGSRGSISRLEAVQKYSPDELSDFLLTKQSATIPADIQRYVLQLDAVARYTHQNRLSMKGGVELLRREFPELTLRQARAIWYDAIDYFYLDDSSSAKAWDMIYADQFEDLKQLAIAADKYDVAYKCMAKAHELRTKVRESESVSWTAPVFLINTEVKPEDLGYPSRKLADIARRAEDRKYREMIMSLETTDAEKSRLLQEAGILEAPDEQGLEDEDEAI